MDGIFRNSVFLHGGAYLHVKSCFIISFVPCRDLLGTDFYVEKKSDCCANFAYDLGPVYIHNFTNNLKIVFSIFLNLHYNLTVNNFLNQIIYDRKRYCFSKGI